MEASPGTTCDDNGFPIYCRPDRLCPECRALSPEDHEYARLRDAREARRAQVAKAAGQRGPRSRQPRRRRSPGNTGWQWETTKGVYGNTVQGAWRRSNSGKWTRS